MYTNHYSRNHPGLVVMLIDQSIAMGDEYGTTICSTFVSKTINSLISELIKRNRNGYDIVNRAYIVLIGHGGNENVNILKSGWLSDYELNPIKRENVAMKYSDCSGGIIEIDCSQPIWVLPSAEGIGNLSDALGIIYQLIDDWRCCRKEKEDVNLSPVPLVINFHSGDMCGISMGTKISNEVLYIVEKIKHIEFPDGEPLVCNIVINANMATRVFPMHCPTDEIESFLYNASSIIPNSMKNLYNRGYTNFSIYDGLVGAERLFVSNISAENMMPFCRSIFDLFYFEWCGMCAGEQNPLLID